MFKTLKTKSSSKRNIHDLTCSKCLAILKSEPNPHKINCGSNLIAELQLNKTACCMEASTSNVAEAVNFSPKTAVVEAFLHCVKNEDYCDKVSYQFQCSSWNPASRFDSGNIRCNYSNCCYTYSNSTYYCLTQWSSCSVNHT